MYRGETRKLWPAQPGAWIRLGIFETPTPGQNPPFRRLSNVILVIRAHLVSSDASIAIRG